MYANLKIATTAS